MGVGVGGSVAHGGVITVLGIAEPSPKILQRTGDVVDDAVLSLIVGRVVVHDE